MALVIYMSNSGRAFTPTARTMVEREKARLLARSGIEIAMSQLSMPDKKEQKKPDEKKSAAPAPEPNEKQEETLFSFIVPRINMGQAFTLKRAIEGIQGEIGICVMCEEGKLNLNELYDPEKGELINKSLSKCMDALFERIQKSVGGAELSKALQKFIKDRKMPLDDVTELLKIKEFAGFKDHIFYEPPEKNAKKGTKSPLYLTDIFTVWSGKNTLQPWLLSDSIRGLLDLSRAQDSTIEERQKVVAEIMKAMPKSLQWPESWNKYLKLLYGKDFATLPKGIELLLDTKFEPKIFSVICYGKVGKTTQKLFAIMERVNTASEKDKQQVNVKLRKLYWI